jgi:uridine phosphorylase
LDDSRWYVAAVPEYLNPTAPIAADAVLPSDPGHALLLAQELLEAPLMSNHSYGLWGYHGETAAGRPLTIQSTGIGGPSAAVVLRELAELGVRRAVRVGACTPLDGALGLEQLLVVARAMAVGDDLDADADTDLTRRLAAAAGPEARVGQVASVDPLRADDLVVPPDVVATDLESAALLALAARVGVAAGTLLATGGRPADAVVVRAGLGASEALAGGGDAAQDSSPALGTASRS